MHAVSCMFRRLTARCGDVQRTDRLGCKLDLRHLLDPSPSLAASPLAALGIPASTPARDPPASGTADSGAAAATPGTPPKPPARNNCVGGGAGDSVASPGVRVATFGGGDAAAEPLAPGGLSTDPSQISDVVFPPCVHPSPTPRPPPLTFGAPIPCTVHE